MRFMMKNKVIYFTVIAAVSAIYLMGCTDLFTNPSNTGGTGSNIAVSISSPVSNDTIGYTGTTINYTLKQNMGINFIELYVNGVINKWNPPNSDGSKPTIPLTVDSSLINTRISYFLIYYDKDGYSARSDTMKNILISQIRVPPSVPYGLSIIPLTSSSVNISWKDSIIGIAPGFEIWRKDGYYGVYHNQLVSPPNTYNINDGNLSDTTVYYYKIRALNINGYSDFSKEVNTYGDGATHTIAPPTGLKAVAVASNKVVLTWYNHVINENYIKIERRYAWSLYQGIANIPKNSTQYADSADGLVPSTEYWYRIKAYSSSDSSWSNEVYVKTPAM